MGIDPSACTVTGPRGGFPPGPLPPQAGPAGPWAQNYAERCRCLSRSSRPTMLSLQGVTCRGIATNLIAQPLNSRVGDTSLGCNPSPMTLWILQSSSPADRVTPTCKEQRFREEAHPLGTDPEFVGADDIDSEASIRLPCRCGVDDSTRAGAEHSEAWGGCAEHCCAFAAPCTRSPCAEGSAA